MLLATCPYTGQPFPDLDFCRLLFCMSHELSDSNKCHLSDKSQVSINTQRKVTQKTTSPGFHQLKFLLFTEVIANFNKVVNILFNETEL